MGAAQYRTNIHQSRRQHIAAVGIQCAKANSNPVDIDDIDRLNGSGDGDIAAGVQDNAVEYTAGRDRRNRIGTRDGAACCKLDVARGDVTETDRAACVRGKA